MRGTKTPNSPHPSIIPESSRFGLVALAVTLLFLWIALAEQTILRLHPSNHTRLRSGGLSFLLANRNGTRLASSTVQEAFDALRRIAGVHGMAGGRQTPRLHDLRHSFAVHSLTAWYRQGADVQRLLPVLSTYLGHSDLEGTKVYLSMTPELLQQASLRFAHYAGGGVNA
jgi:integrase